MPDHADQPDPLSRATAGLETLLRPELDALFARPHPLDTAAAHDRQAHLPFAGWLAGAARPALLVTLGPGGAPFHAAFCDAVGRDRQAARCFLVAGDDPGEAARDALLAAHDRRHGAASRILFQSPTTAAAGFEDGAVDLLCVAPSAADDVASRACWHAWLPRLSPRATVLIHGINAPESLPDTGRFWAELHRRHPSFAFLHGDGLGILGTGGSPPDALSALFALSRDPAGTARLRDRVALLGERWLAEARLDRERRRGDALREAAAAADRSLAASEAAAADRDALNRALDESRGTLLALSAAHDRLRDELAFAKADRFRLERRLAEQADALQAERARWQRDRAEADIQADRRARSIGAAMAGQVDRALAAGGEALATLRDRGAADRAAHAAALGAAALRIEALQDALAAAAGQIAQRHETLRLIRGSLSWRVTAPLRGVRDLFRTPVPRAEPAAIPDDATAPAALPVPALPPEPVPDPVPDPLPGPAPILPPAIDPPEQAAPAAPPPDPGHDTAFPAAAVAEPRWRPLRRVLFVAGEPGTPGAVYRTLRQAEACRAAGFEAECVDIAGVNPDNLAAADLLVLWRAGFSGHVQIMLKLAAAARTRVAFDVDDLIVQPALAVAEIIDGIRTTFVTEAESRAYFQSMQRTLLNCDLCTTTTAELAAAIGPMHPVAHVLPNGFDASVERASRRALRLRGEGAGDGRVRLGYAGGTRTHQKDFALIAPALAAVLEERPQALLVLFRDPASGEGLVLLEEFPELLPFADRVEWRDLVPLPQLPSELARFDVSLCPLERDNPFCEAKSELKYFESALAGVCTVASPTGPFRRAIRDGITGFLPETGADWSGVLLRLIDDPPLRGRVAQAAYHDVLWQFGPRRQVELWASLLAELDGGVSGSRASELRLRRGAYRAAELPEVPDGVVLYSYDALREARVTVGMTSFNYERFLPEALESVLAQTLGPLDLVVVDDGSRDGSVPLLLDWAERNRTRFNRLRILRTRSNAGLGGARNLVFAQAETPWVMVLDSDNRLAPEACARLLEAAERDGLAAFSYPLIRQFGGADTLMGAHAFEAGRLASGNYVDAMALVAKWAWAAAGGYYNRRDAMGWEDFSLWCRLLELGLHGVPVTEELAFYRVHASSMVDAITEQSDNKRAMVSFVEARHPWLRLRMRASRKRPHRPGGAG